MIQKEIELLLYRERLGLLELLETTALDESQREHLEMAIVSAKDLAILINDTLDLSKIEAGMLELEDIRFSVADVIDTKVTVFALEAEKKGLVINKEIS